MPSKAKSQPSLKEIRAFFEGKGAANQPSSRSKTAAGDSSLKPIELIDSDDEMLRKSGVTKPTPQPLAKRKRNVLISDDSEGDGLTPVKHTPAPHAPRSPPKPASSKVTTNKSPKHADKATSSNKSKKQRLLSSSESEDSDEFRPSSDDEGNHRRTAVEKNVSSPTRARASTGSVAAKGKTLKRSRVEDDEESEAAYTPDEKPKKRAKPTASSSARPRKAVTASTNKSLGTPESSAKRKGGDDDDISVNEGSRKEVEVPRKKWIPGLQQGPEAPGTKTIPEGGDPNALAGLAIVFTGELSAFSRDEAIEMAKRFGGRVTTAPSGKTDFVVVGRDSGPKKLEIIKKLRIKTLSEDGFLNLIATRKGILDKKQLEKQEKEEMKLKKDAAELGRREKEAKTKGVDPRSQLWTTRYAPRSMKEVVGNKSNAEKIQQWLHDWPNSLKSDFKKPGPNGLNVFRALLISGPPGIGKTTSAHLAAKLEGYTPIELNASDARSKKLVESSTNISNTSLDGWMSGKSSQSTTVAGFNITDNTVLIMDEVDGMSAGDRGGIGALNALIKKTRIPIICIANDRRSQKIKPLTSTCYNMTFTKPNVAQVRARMMTVATREKIKFAPNVIDSLIEGANSDIRQVLNMLSTWKLSHDAMDFDQGKELAKANQKHLIMTPYTIIDKLFGPYTFSETSRETLIDKMDYYFQDHSFIPLFVQENYVKTTPARLRHSTEGPEADMKRLELLEKASSSISDGDLVDTMIHRDTQWGLMPLHAIHSTVKPAYFMYGKGLGYGFKDNGIAFPSWLGQNSKQSKLQRQLVEVQIRMRLKVSGDRAEIRQSYIPALFPRIVRPLMDKGSGADEVEEIIEYMNEYYVSKDDWDTIVELGVGDCSQDGVLKKIPSSTKTVFTKRYNASEHPIPFHKATEFGTKVKKIAKGEMPDHEDVLDNEDEIDEPEDAGNESEDYDISKDKLIKQPKVASKSKSKASSSSTKSTKTK